MNVLWSDYRPYTVHPDGFSIFTTFYCLPGFLPREARNPDVRIFGRIVCILHG